MVNYHEHEFQAQAPQKIITVVIGGVTRQALEVAFACLC